MSFPISRAIAIVVLTTGSLSGRADTGFDLKVEKVELPEMGTVTRCHLTTEKGSYSFRPPFNWRIEVDPSAKQLNLTSPDTTRLVVSYMVRDSEPATNDSPRSGREMVIQRYPNAKILGEAPGYGSEGMAFDLEQVSSGGTVVLSRVVYRRMKDELIEFHLTARADRFHDSTFSLLTLLGTFESSVAGGRIAKAVN